MTIGVVTPSPPIIDKCSATAADIIEPTKAAPYSDVLGITKSTTDNNFNTPINSM